MPSIYLFLVIHIKPTEEMAMARTINEKEIFQKSEALLDKGEYIDGSSIQVNINHKISIIGRSDTTSYIKVFYKDKLVFHVVEKFDCELIIFQFTKSKWIDAIFEAHD